MEDHTKDLHQALWKVLKILVWCSHYPMHSDYYQYKDAAEDLSKGLPEEERQPFLDFVHERIKGYSNFSND